MIVIFSGEYSKIDVLCDTFCMDCILSSRPSVIESDLGYLAFNDIHKNAFPHKKKFNDLLTWIDTFKIHQGTLRIHFWDQLYHKKERNEIFLHLLLMTGDWKSPLFASDRMCPLFNMFLTGCQGGMNDEISSGYHSIFLVKITNIS